MEGKKFLPSKEKFLIPLRNIFLTQCRNRGVLEQILSQFCYKYSPNHEEFSAWFLQILASFLSVHRSILSFFYIECIYILYPPKFFLQYFCSHRRKLPVVPSKPYLFSLLCRSPFGHLLEFEQFLFLLYIFFFKTSSFP